LLALILAFIINSGYVRFKDFFRAAYFMPFVASAVAVGISLHHCLVCNTACSISHCRHRFSPLLTAGDKCVSWAIETNSLGCAIDWLGSALWLKPSIALVKPLWQWTGYFK
jgi:ABC-type sugar transport system permease subunit